MTKELLLEISYDCNLNCLHCSSVNCFGKIEVSDLDGFDSIIKEIDIVRLSGGEALLNHDLIDYVDYFYDRGIKIILQTNGSIEIPVDVYNKLHMIYLSLYSNEQTHNFITRNDYSFKDCIDKIKRYSNIVLCSPMFSIYNSINLIEIAMKYDLYIRFTSLLNHGKCNFAEPIESQIAFYNLVSKQWDKIIPHCSLTGECDMDNKFVIKPDLTVLKCASNKHGKGLCKNSI